MFLQIIGFLRRILLPFGFPLPTLTKGCPQNRLTHLIQRSWIQRQGPHALPTNTEPTGLSFYPKMSLTPRPELSSGGPRFSDRSAPSESYFRSQSPPCDPPPPTACSSASTSASLSGRTTASKNRPGSLQRSLAWVGYLCLTHSHIAVGSPIGRRQTRPPFF